MSAGNASASAVVLIGFARTPFGKFGSHLAGLSLPVLGAHAARVALERAAVDAERVDEVVFGVNFPGGDRSIARQLALRVGVPDDRPATTVDRACCSSLAATAAVARGLRLGECGIGLAGGVENLSGVPFTVPGLRFGQRLGQVVLDDPLVISCPHTGVPRAKQAGDEALEHGIGREEQDRWAARSHRLYVAAAARAAFDDEIAPAVFEHNGGSVVLDRDECPRASATEESLAKLPTVYGSPTVTAGNAPNLSTGASALVLTTDEKAGELGAQPLARFLSFAQLAGAPHQIASIPARAAQLALDRAGRSLEEMDLIEVNEAFAAVPLVSTLAMAGGDHRRAAELRERTNVNGGALAVGHPTGATGARLVMTLVAELRRRGGGLGLVTICGGIGEAEAAVVEVSGGR